MWNANCKKAGAIFLAALMIPAGGCDDSAAQTQVPMTASDARQTQPPKVQYQVDPARNRVWLLTNDGVFVYESARSDKIVVSLPGWQWVDAQYSSLPDLTLGPKGEAVVTSNIVPTLWRVDPESLAISVHTLALDSDTDKDVGFTGLVYSSEDQAYFAVSGIHGSLWRIDPLFERAEKVHISVPLRKAFGLAMQRRGPQRKAGRLSGICVSAPERSWTIDFAPGQRSASVGAASCPDRADS